jgi:hypothetical protein
MRIPMNATTYQLSFRALRTSLHETRRLPEWGAADFQTNARATSSCPAGPS